MRKTLVAPMCMFSHFRASLRGSANPDRGGVVRWRRRSALCAMGWRCLALHVGAVVMWTLAGLPLTGCALGEHAHSDHPVAGTKSQPPMLMDHLTASLMTYRAMYAQLPPTLHDLVELEMLSARAYEIMPRYAYFPAGLGVLDDGRRILLADAYVRPGDQAWCIVEGGVSSSPSAQLELVALSLDDLRRAADLAKE